MTEPECAHDHDRFDRTICPEPCGAMHTRCSDCGIVPDQRGCALKGLVDERATTADAIDWIEAELAMEDGNFRDVAEILADARARFT